MMVRPKRIVVISLCLTIIVLSFGFGILSIKINDRLNSMDVFDVSFSDVKLISSKSGGDTDPEGKVKIKSLGKAIDMDFSLFMENDELEYEIKVTNNGDIAASIVDLLMITSNDNVDNSDVKISLSDISGKILDPGEEVPVKLKVTYNQSNSNTLTNIQEKKLLERNITGKIGLLVESSNNK